MNPDAPEQDPPVQAAISPYVAARPLKRYVGQHNRQALLLSLFSLVAAVFLWGMLYAFVYWFSLTVVTLTLSFNVNTLGQVSQRHLLGTNFAWWFAGGAVIYLGIAAIIRRNFRVEKLRESRFYLFWVLLELFMAIPNVTFSIWGNLRAFTKLGRNEIVGGWYLLQRMNQEDGRLSLSSLRLEIDDEKMLCRVMFALQIMGLVGMRESSGGWFLYLQGQEVRNLLKQAA